jgi:hypothetical protein
LLILAGITINTLFGENGILTRAQNAKDENISAQEIEEISTAYTAAFIADRGENVSTNITASDIADQFEINGVNATTADVSGKIKIDFPDSGNSYYLYVDEKETTGKDPGTVEKIEASNGDELGLTADLREKIDKAIEDSKATLVGEKYIVTLDDDGKTYQKDEDGYYEELDVSKDTTPGELTGSGTASDPYKIQSIEDLVAFSYNVNTGLNSYEGKVVVLERNLYFDGSYNSYYDETTQYASLRNGEVTLCAYRPASDTSEVTGTYTGTVSGDIKTLMTERTFIPIGIGSNTFKGTFDGQGHYLAGIYFNSAFFTIFSGSIQITTGIGMFGNSSTGITIKNFGLETGYYIDGASVNNIGMILGCAYGSGDTDISNCYNKIDITCGKASQIAGIIGKVYSTNSLNVNLTNCYNKGNVTVSTSSSSTFVGGIISYVDYSAGNINITNCYNTGNITGYKMMSGIVAYCYSGTYEIKNCYNTGNLTVTASSMNGAGGIFGWSNSNCNSILIDNCYNTGNITSTNAENIGGIAAYIAAYTNGVTISNSYNLGTINSQSSSNTYCGGIVGYSYPVKEITNCYNDAEITVSSSGGMFGGIGAYLYSFMSDNQGINKCYNKGNITATGTNNYSIYLGGILGYEGSSCTGLDKCYNEGNIYVEKYPSSSVGGVAGYLCSSKNFYNCYNIGNITVENITSDNGIGGLIGYGNSTLNYIFNSYNLGNVTGYQKVGGIVGYTGTKNIENCYNKGNVNSSQYAGGICGSEYTSSNYVNCYNFGEINSSGEIKNSYGAGGIVGYGYVVLMSKCYNKGTITSDYSGGIIGKFDGTTMSISDCHNIGDVKESTSSTNVGEIIGYGTATVTDCTYLKKDSNANANGATGVKDISVTMSVTNFIKLMNDVVTENNKSEDNVKLYSWKEENGLPVFDI